MDATTRYRQALWAKVGLAGKRAAARRLRFALPCVVAWPILGTGADRQPVAKEAIFTGKIGFFQNRSLRKCKSAWPGVHQLRQSQIRYARHCVG
jgi:hypothetical protein